MAKKKESDSSATKIENVENNEEVFVENIVKEEVEEANPQVSNTQVSKSLDIFNVEDAKKKVDDIVIVGDGDTMQLLCKASSESQGWMKSANAMEIKGVGCLVQFTTQQKNIDGTYSIAETCNFVPNSKLRPDVNNGKKLVSQNSP